MLGSKFHILEIVVRNILFLTNIKKTKETKNFSVDRPFSIHVITNAHNKARKSGL